MPAKGEDNPSQKAPTPPPPAKDAPKRKGRSKVPVRKSKEVSKISQMSQVSQTPTVNSGNRSVPDGDKKKPSKRKHNQVSAVSTATKETKETRKIDFDFEKLRNTTFLTEEDRKLKFREHLRLPMVHGEYLMQDEKSNKMYLLRLEPVDRCRLKHASEILIETAKIMGDSDKTPFIKCIEYSTNTSLHVNYLLLTPYYLKIYEVLKIVDHFTPGCAFNVALQALEGIRYLHKAGFINRHVKPATFAIGYGGEQEKKIMLTDFRLAKRHIDPATKTVIKARDVVKYCGSSRYASIASLNKKEQGRRDDLESWIYMFYEMIDEKDGLSWKGRMPRNKMLINEKIQFSKNNIASTYTKVPEELKPLVEMVFALQYEQEPDYNAIRSLVEDVAKTKNYDISACDWIDRITLSGREKAVDAAMNPSSGNRVSGADEFKGKKQKPVRKILQPNDVIKNECFTWKVVSLLGSGGFGDVYKVHDEKNKEKHYALKTESEEGKKMMLRLKVEMQVLVAITDARKASTGSNKHFVEFVDRGKNEELKCKYIVMSLVGPSLDDCRKKYLVRLDQKHTPYIIGIQSVQAVRDLHAIGFLHRDIKPANFAVGFQDTEPYVFMLDFGIGRSYLDPKTKQHRAPRKSVKFLGTLRFASRACMKGSDQGRKDDLECWLYMIYDIFDPIDGISWKETKGKMEIGASKEYFFKKKLPNTYERIPTDMHQLVTYIDGLKFQSTPDYDYISQMLYKIAAEHRCPVRNLKDGNWVGKVSKVPKAKPKVRADRFGDSDSDSDGRASDSGQEEED